MPQKSNASSPIKSARLEIVEIAPIEFSHFFKNDFTDVELREKYFLGFDPPNYCVQLPLSGEIRSFFACLSKDIIGGLQMQENTLSFFIRSDFVRLGIATEMVTAATDHFLTSGCSSRIWARTLRSNDASRRVLAKAGFREVCLEYRTLKNGFRAPIVLHAKS